MDSATDFRVERDSLGEAPVPVRALWGINTERAVRNFAVSGTIVGQYPALVAALATVKAAAALANAECGVLSEEKRDAILAACDRLRRGEAHDHFVVDMIQGGAGTSTNMNANEVIANLALEHMGRAPGDYAALHPHDDVNASQSTNDVYPTAVRLAILMMKPALQRAMEELLSAFGTCASAFADVPKVGRTQLQDALPMTIGAEFRGFAVTVGEDIARLNEAAALLCEVNLGGTAIGTVANAPRTYGDRAIGHLAKLTGLRFEQSADLIEASSDLGAFVTFSSTLKRIAVKQSKICNDLRLLSSGPFAGFAQIVLPPVQAGSSLMPGKVNPVIPEMLNQVAFQVLGNDLTVTFAAEAGQLQLNAMLPVVALNILQSMTILTRGIETLSRRCVMGITIDAARGERLLGGSLGLVTALVPILGYETATKVAKRARIGGLTVEEALADLGIDDPRALAVSRNQTAKGKG